MHALKIQLEFPDGGKGFYVLKKTGESFIMRREYRRMYRIREAHFYRYL